MDDDKDLELLNRALNHAVADDVITDSEADHLYTRYTHHVVNRLS